VPRWLLALFLAAWAVGCASLPTDVQRTPSKAFAAPEQTALGRMIAERRVQDKARSESGFALLDGVEPALAARLALVQAAQRTLDLQYYAIHADASTEVLLQQLRQAARRGVRVRLLLDDFNTVGKDAQVLRLAFEPNVEIRLFNPLPGSRESLIARIFTSLHDVARIQKRMHNKMFIADSAVGITGGRNLGDAYFGGDGKSSFVDLDVLAAGPIVRAMAASFDRFWNDELAYPMQSLVSAQDLEKLKKQAEPDKGDKATGILPAAVAAPKPLTAAAPTPTSSILPNMTRTAVIEADPGRMDLRSLALTWAPALLLHDKPDKIGPGDDEVNAGDTVIDGLLQLMSQARQDVLIVSPYFVPGALMMDHFRQLRDRGVRVRVLTNSLASNDAPAAHAGYARYRKDLLALGVELHEMRAGESSGEERNLGGAGSKSATSRASLHSKAVVIDERMVVIGSMNLDLRSQLQNSEAALLIRSAALSRQAIRSIEPMMNQSSYRLELNAGNIVWRAPRGAAFRDATSEPEAGVKLRMLVRLIGPFAPDEML